MLYCPKCQQTYEEGVQRFCLNDGGRLLPAPSSGKSINQSDDVFSGVINRQKELENDEFASAPRFSQMKFQKPPSRIAKPEFDTNFDLKQNNKDQSFDENDIELEIVAPVQNRQIAEDSLLEIEPESELISSYEKTSTETNSSEEPKNITALDEKAEENKPGLRLVKPEEISNGRAALGDRKTDPVGRKPINWENPDVLIGHAIKGRYNVLERLGISDDAIDYLAEDKINHSRKVVVRVLMNENSSDSFAGKIFAEERTALSHINHPNVVKVIDSGELLEGKPFVVTEYVKGESIESRLQRKGKFDALRTARIIRQAAYALSEVHQSGILHRDLKPENIILTVSDLGAEQVKLINFAASKNSLNEKNLRYKSPEQVEGKLAHFASDEFALAVIAYQMLTAELPFKADKIGALLKEQREGVSLKASVLNEKLPASIDEILAKALSFNAADRYPKARDFGDALFNAIEVKKPSESSPEAAENALTPISEAPLIEKDKQVVVLEPIIGKVSESEKKPETANGEIKATAGLAWEKRSPELPDQNNGSRTSLALLSLAILIVGLFGVWYYFVKKVNEVKVALPTPVQSVTPIEQNLNDSTVLNKPTQTPEDIESPPLMRTVSQPPNTNYFQNAKSDLTGDLSKNFLGFSLYYPNSWKLNETKSNFLDVSKTNESNLPVEQMIVSYYDSKGTFKADRELFPKLLEKSNADLNKALGDYKIISQGETSIQNGRWQAFEVKFESVGTAPNGEKITLWGRRLWVPAQRVGLKNGYVITMLATSLSPDVKSVEDVGAKGELSSILETFEPNQNF